MNKITLIFIMAFIGFSGYSQVVLLENFDNPTVIGPVTGEATWLLPSGTWQIFDNGTGAEDWKLNDPAATYPAFSGTNAAFIERENIGSGNVSQDYLVTPLLVVPQNPQLRFQTRSSTALNNGTIYEIRVAAGDSDPTLASSYTTLVASWTEEDLTATYNVYEEKVVNLPSASGSSIYLAFVKVQTQTGTTVSGDRWLIDDIKILSKCPDAQNLAAITTATTAELSWDNPGEVIGWNVYVLPQGTAFVPANLGVPFYTEDNSAYQVSQTTELIPAGLVGLTNYVYYLQSVCEISQGDWVTSEPFKTQVGQPVCGGIFTDEGGPAASYLPGSNSVTTICGDTLGDIVTVAFTDFNLSPYYDGMYIYDGDSTSAPMLPSSNGFGFDWPNLETPGAYWGTDNPGIFVGSSASGCLTFHFLSDDTTNETGWVADVTCSPAPSCQKPTAFALGAAITDTTIDVSWTAVGVATQWMVFALPCGAPIPTLTTAGGILTSGTEYTITDLDPVTCYEIYVISVCSADSSSTAAGPKKATTKPTPAICGGVFTDDGGAENDYPQGSNATILICPQTAGDVVTVSFTDFDITVNYDGLYIYDGNSTAAPMIGSDNPAGFTANLAAPGAYWGTANPGVFESSSPDGCLTFHFFSEAWTSGASGWVANVTCGPAPACPKPTAIALGALTTSTTIDVSWTSASAATSWMVFAVPCGSAVPTLDTVGGQLVSILPTAAMPYVITGLDPITCYQVYVIALCPGGGNSTVAGPKTASTKITPPACGGFFTDEGGPGNYPLSSNSVVTICPDVAGEIVSVTFTEFETYESFDGLYVYDGDDISAPLFESGNDAGFSIGLQVPGAYWGFDNPGSFEATNADGCLTFQFSSEGFTGGPGWSASVSCAPATDCQKPTGLVAGASADTTIPVSWIPAGPASQWMVFAVPCGSPVPSIDTDGGQLTSVLPTVNTPFLLTGLSPETCYQVYVYSVCSTTDHSNITGPIKVYTQIEPPICGELFTDIGGADDNYPGGTNSIVTICPEELGDVVTVDFTEFSVQEAWDGLYIHNGNSVFAPLVASTNGAGANSNLEIPGAYWGTVLPGEFESSSPDGCLTFQFFSESWSSALGWSATITCGPAPTCPKPTLLTVTATTTTSVTVDWTDTMVPLSWEVLVIPALDPAPTATSTGWQPAAVHPFTFDSLDSGTAYKVYVRAVCSDTDSSKWSFPASFNTLITNDICATATIVNVNPDTSCSQIASGILLGATVSGVTNGCGVNPNEDVWFEFTATASQHYITLLNANNSYLAFALFTGECGALQYIACSDLSTSSLITDGVNAGQTYYIQVFSPFMANAATAFDICIGILPPSIETEEYPAEDLVNLLVGSPCAAITNITSSTGSDFGSVNGIGHFTRNGSSFPFEEGIVLSTGDMSDAPGPNINALESGSETWTGDTDLEDILGVAGYDMSSLNASKIEFDFVPITPSIAFRFIFASEEYGLYQCEFSDSFAFILTDITDGTDPVNLAIVPDTTIPISVVTIHNDQFNDECESANALYFDTYYQTVLGGMEPFGAPIDFNGTAVPLTASSAVIPGHTYHLKMVIADNADPYYDSAVFIEGGNFDTGNIALGPDLLVSDDTALCSGSSIVLDSGLPLSQYTFVWTQNGETLDAISNTLEVTEAGIYGVTATYVNTVCSSTETIKIEFFNAITLDPVVDISQCSPYVLDTPTVGHYYTEPGGQGEILDNTTISAVGQTTVYLYAASGPACVSESSFTVTILSVTADVLPDVSVCGEFILPALSASNHYWTGIGCTETELFADGVIDSSQTIYICTGNGDCSDSSNFVVEVNTPPSIAPLENVQSCGPYELPVLTTGNYFAASGGVDPILGTVSALGTHEVYVYAEGAIPGCSGEAMFVVTILSPPVLEPIEDVISCGPYALPEIEGVSYYNATAGTGEEITSVSESQAVFAYSVGDSPACSSEQQFMVTVTDVPQLAINGDCVGGSYVLNAIITNEDSQRDYSYAWSTIGGEIVSGDTTAHATVSGQGTYTLTVKVLQLDCEGTAQELVNTTSCMIQKGISANGDGKNDVFDLEGLGVAKLEIYNRYGSKVYERKDYTNQWAGQSDKGEELPDGTYYYVIQSQNTSAQTGWIYLNRQN